MACKTFAFGAARKILAFGRRVVPSRMNKSAAPSTVRGLFWSLLDNFAFIGIQFLIGIILARILAPREFGLIGIIVAFTTVAQAIVDCGFPSALIRKVDCRQTDYSTVFYCNLGISLVLTLILILSAGAIAQVFKEPRLEHLIQAVSFCIVINAAGVIQRTIFIKRIDFREQMIVSVISALGAGSVGITLAYMGFGVWSLAIMMLLLSTLNTMFFWILSSWRPDLSFSYTSFREMFGFGSKLLVSGLIDSIYTNLYGIVIGKVFSVQELGYFTRAQQFQTVPSRNLAIIVTRVAYPKMATLQHDDVALRAYYRKLVRVLMYISFMLMFGLAATSKSLILFTIGPKWTESILYMQMLCLAGVLYPLSAVNLSIVQLRGRSGLFLIMEIMKKMMVIPVVAVGVFFGIQAMIKAIIVESIISFFINSSKSKQMTGYSSFDQLCDIAPSFAVAACMAAAVFAFGEVVTLPYAWMFLSQVALGIIVVVGLSKPLKLPEYEYFEAVAVRGVRKLCLGRGLRDWRS